MIVISASPIFHLGNFSHARGPDAPQSQYLVLYWPGGAILRGLYALNDSVYSTLSNYFCSKRCRGFLDEVWSDAPLLQARTLHAPDSPCTMDARQETLCFPDASLYHIVFVYGGLFENLFLGDDCNDHSSQLAMCNRDDCMWCAVCLA
jgi:hypothetical protein